MNYDTWKNDIPEDSTPEDYKSERYIALERMYAESEQRELEIKEWYKKVKHIKGINFKKETEHYIDICTRSQHRIGLAMDNEVANY